MKVLIVENDPLIVEDLNDKLQKLGYPSLPSADNVDDALGLVEEQKPDVVLVDIELNGEKDGIDLGGVLNEKGVPFIYLSRLQDQRTFDRARATNPQTNIPKPVSHLQLRNSLLEIDFSDNANEGKAFISVSKNGKKTILNKEDITWLKADRNYCLIYVGEKRHQSSTPMNNVLKTLDPKRFVQVHRSYAVNVYQVEKYEGNMIYMKGVKEPVSISDTYRYNFLKYIDAV